MKSLLIISVAALAAASTGQTIVEMSGCETGKLVALPDRAFSEFRQMTDRRICEIRATPNMDIPAGAEDGDLVETAAAFAIPDGQSKDLAAFVYPSEAPEGGKYTCDITFSFDADSDGTPETFSYTDLEVLDSRAVNIASLSRNQSLHVLIRIGKGQTLSFNFSVGEWTSLTETVLFE